MSRLTFVIDKDELGAWLRLLSTAGVGRGSARKLLAALGSPQHIFDASERIWGSVVPAGVARSLAKEPESLLRTLTDTWAWLNATSDDQRDVLTLGDSQYPLSWLESSDPPLLVYTQGKPELLQQPSIAIVGSRNATPQGLENARAFAEFLSGNGLTVVSGLALGIDGAAHRGGLSGTGSTVAIVGTGLDRVYPRQHIELAREISRKGVLVSEFPPGTPSLPSHFPQRNRLIAGLSRGTLVVEAILQSGSLITAKMAMDGGREVFAIPGSIHSPQAKGCHALIKQGAKLVETGADILEELQWQTKPAAGAGTAAIEAPSEPNKDLAQGGHPLLDQMGHDPVSLEVLSIRTGIPAQRLQAQLLELELSGDVSRMPGSLFQRSGRG